MESESKTRRGRPPRPAALRRSEWLKVRVSSMELEAMQVRADAEGLSLSAFVRSRCCVDPEPVARRSREVARLRTAEGTAPGDLEALTQRLSATMPRRNAEHLARRELARRGG